MAQRYGEWKVDQTLGEGGQAHIFLVSNECGEQAVLKRLKNVNRLKRFEQEVSCIKNDPAGFYPRIFEINLDTDKPYYVMEYFPKGKLTAEIVRTWSLRRKVGFLVRVMASVAYANLQGVIHRDLKPDNILLDDELRPKISDFGIAYVDETGARETLTEEAVGSFKFMAPEVEDGRSDVIGPHTDVYAVGKIAYWIFSGGAIYNRERHRDADFDLTSKIEGHWTYFFNDFLDKATNHNHTQRVGTCEELIVEFGSVRKAITDEARYLDTTIEQPCAFCRRGAYRVVVDAVDSQSGGATDVGNFGFRPVGTSQWRILVCDVCGNVQSFRKEYAKLWAWKR